MAYHIVGLDIGSRNVRAVLLERSFRGYEVVEARQAPITQGEEGGTPSQAAVAEAVMAVVGDLPRSETAVICAYPLERASVWFFTLPFNDPRRIAQTVAFEVEDMVPFDLEDMLFVYRVVKADANTSHIMATLAPRAEIGERLARLGEMSQDPLALLLDAHALINAVPGAPNEVRALIDVGHRRTVISIARGAVLEHVQALPVGGLDVTRALMQRWDLPFDVAEHLKHERALPASFGPAGAPEASPAAAPPAFDPEATLRLPQAGDPVDDGEPADEADVTTLSWRQLDDDTTADINTLGDVDFAAMAFEEDTTPGRAYQVVPQPMGGVDEDGEWEAAPALDAPPAPPVEADPHPTLTAQAVQEVIDQAVGEMLGPIRAALIAYEAGHRGEVDRVYLVGGGARLPELSQALEGDLGVPVGPVARLGDEKVALPGAVAAGSFAMAFALGLRGVTDGKLHEIDFRREEFASRGDIQRFRVGLVATAAAVLLVAFVGLVWSALEYRSLTHKQDDIDAQIATLVQESVPDAGPVKSAEQALVVLTDEQMALQERARVLGVATDQPPGALRTLREVSDYLSPGSPGDDDFLKVDIDEYQAGDGLLKLKGSTDSFESTGKMEASLGKSPLFTDVTSETSVDRRKEDRKNFSMTMTVVSEGVDLEDPS